MMNGVSSRIREKHNKYISGGIEEDKYRNKSHKNKIKENFLKGVKNYLGTIIMDNRKID